MNYTEKAVNAINKLNIFDGLISKIETKISEINKKKSESVSNESNESNELSESISNELYNSGFDVIDKVNTIIETHIGYKDQIKNALDEYIKKIDELKKKIDELSITVNNNRLSFGLQGYLVQQIPKDTPMDEYEKTIFDFAKKRGHLNGGRRNTRIKTKKNKGLSRRNNKK